MEEEKRILFNSSTGLLEIGKNLKNINPDIANMIFFLSGQVLNIADERGYTELNKEEGQCVPSQCDCGENEKVQIVEGQKPIHNCNGHSNTPNPSQSIPDNVQGEVRNLVDKIRAEHGNVKQG